MGKEIITAALAKETAGYAIKLKNIISRNIKEEAEMGKCQYLYVADNLALGVEESIIKTFRNNGFIIETAYETRSEISDAGVELYSSDITYFTFRW